MISVNNITVKRGEHLVLDNFSASVAQGSATLLSGPNGSGKTTLIHAISGSLPLQKGAVEINDRDISHLTARELAGLRSVAPQRRLFTLSFSVAEILNFVDEKHRNEHWKSTIESLGLIELLDEKVTELSVGQQQRVSVALALVQEAEFYLLDEPLSAQDSEFQSRIISALKILATKKGVLVVSHNTDSLHSQFDQEIRLS